MEKFTQITSFVIPLPMKNVDTDMIIPAQFLTSVSREGFAQNLFRRLKEQDANFPFNRKEYNDAQILCADDNFGCGSSREHAVWALLGAGIRVVIAKSFADIFTSNSAKNGLVLVTLPTYVIDEILKSSENVKYCITVNLVDQLVTLPDGKQIGFPFDAFRKHCIINGLDDLDYISSHADAINEYVKKSMERRFFSSLIPNHGGNSR